MGGVKQLILVVEDDNGQRELIAGLFERAGFSVSAAATGPQALALAEQEPPSAAVLDVNLPGLSGYEVCRALRERFGPALPVIFVSGERVEAYDRVAGLMLGADDYLVKPFADDELLARVRALLRRSRTHDAADGGSRSPLTRREEQVLRLLADGVPPREIARRLTISPKTVATHIERIRSKLGVRSRAQAVAVAYRDGLLRP